MVKRLILALAFAGLLSPAYPAGTIPYSLSQQLDQYGKPLAGGKLYLIQAGTVRTPQSCYQDSALTIALPNPITLDASGRVPQLFCADGSIKVILTDKFGVTQVQADGILVIGPSGGGGGGSTVDPTTILTTGDIKTTYGTGVIAGFVRANGRTIGSATSGATERANADTQSLFQYLWNADANLAVSTGRGASAAADWAANKTIALPDWRGRAIAGLDDMGNTAAGRLTSTYFGTAATVLGAAGGAESRALTIAQIPANIPVSVTGSIVSAQTATGDAGVLTGNALTSAVPGGATFGVTIGVVHQVPVTGTISGTGTASGSGTAHAVASPMMLATIYVKL